MKSYQREALREILKKYTIDLPSFKWGKDTYYIDSRRRYQNGTMYIECLTSNLQCWGILSCNIPHETSLLGPLEFFAKTWSENEGWSKAALDSGIFIDTGHGVPTGFCFAPIWRCNF